MRVAIRGFNLADENLKKETSWFRGAAWDRSSVNHLVMPELLTFVTERQEKYAA